MRELEVGRVLIRVLRHALLNLDRIERGEPPLPAPRTR